MPDEVCLSITMDMSSVDREMPASFLVTKAGCFPTSGEIVGISKTMDDEMKASLKEAEDGEKATARTKFRSLVASNLKDLNALTESIETERQHPTRGVKRMSPAAACHQGRRGPPGDMLPHPVRLLRQRIGNEGQGARSRPSD